MRKLVYDCYSNQNKVKTVTSFDEANKWKNANKNNFIKEKLINISNENENFKINQEEMYNRVETAINKTHKKSN